MLGRMLAGRTGLSPVMVGRSSPLARLTALATGATAPAVALVAGEAGVGKTRLLREFTHALPPGITVLAGQADTNSLGRPFELVRTVLGVAQLPEGADLVAVAVAEIGSRVGSRGVVIFEDLHWADAESVEVFERLAASNLPILLVGTFRPDELTRMLPAADMLVRLDRRHTVQHYRLDRLSRAEVQQFLHAVYGRVVPSAAVEMLHTRTGGNPFFLEELLASAGDLDPDQLAVQPLPWSLAELVRRQLDGLSPDERRVVDATAVLGRGAAFDVLATVTGMTEAELIAILRGLVGRGLVIEDEPDQFTFRHALVRDAVEGQLLGRERRRLHEAALDALKETSCVELVALARHAAGAGHYEELIALAREGVDQYLEQGSTFLALQLALCALAEAPDDLVLLAGAARAAWLVGLNDESLSYAESWERHARTPEERCAALRVLARLHWERGDSEARWKAVDEIEALVPSLGDGVERGIALAHLAQAHMLDAHVTDAVRWADEALESVAGIEGDAARQVRAQALIEKGSALLDAQDHSVLGEEILRDGIELAEAVGDFFQAARGYNNMTKIIPANGPDGRDLVERLANAVERAGLEAMGQTNLALRRVDLAVAQADRPAAQELLSTVDLVPLERPGRRAAHLGAWPVASSATLAIEDGDFAAAVELIASLSDLFQEPGYEDRQWLAVLLLQIAVHAGDAAEVKTRWEALRRIPLSHVRSWPECVLEPIDAGVGAGIEPGELRGWVDQHRPLAEREPWFPLAEAWMLSAEGDTTAAIGSWDALLGPGEDDLGLPNWLLASARARYARDLRAVGRTADALAQAEQARRLLDRWPGWRRDAIDALLTRLRSASPVDGPVELTPREREVAALIAEGLSNAELARRLFISPKTAAVHVSNILTKLGMTGRAEVAAWAVRTGVATAVGAPGGRN